MAGFFGTGNYMKEGKGIEKDAPKKRSIFLFFELFFRKFSKLIMLNLLYLVTIIPTVIVVFILSGFISSAIIEYFSPAMNEIFNFSGGNIIANEDYTRFIVYFDVIIRCLVTILFTVLWGMGPATCGFSYVLRNYSREEHSWLVSDFFGKAKKNFKQGIIVWIIDLVMLFVLCNAYVFYNEQDGFLEIIKYFILTIAVIYTFMHLYIYQLIITFELPIKEIYRNSLILALGKLPRNILVLAALIFVVLVLPYASIFSQYFDKFIIAYLILVVLILFSFCGFLMNFFVYPVIKKEMLSKADPEKYGIN